MAELSDPRKVARDAWTRAVLGTTDIELVRASVDAGLRSYWRVQGENAASVVMDSPPDRGDVRPWLRIRELIQAAGVRVPRVLAHDAEAGFVLLEDLGGPPLAQVIDTDNAEAHFDAAIGQLLKLQAITPPDDLGVFGPALLQRDAGLFRDWFLDRHLGLQLGPSDSARLASIERLLMDNALLQPRVPTHRDFMPRNLMPVPDGPAVLDFQDMVVGPIAYDPVSLFKDAFLSWPLPRVDGWLASYHARASDAGLPLPPLERFMRDADWMGVQRHLKILGIFARLHHRDGKPRYLADAPRFITYLDEVLPRHAELAPLQELVEHKIKPALAQPLPPVRRKT